jgi:hypothetical protein
VEPAGQYADYRVRILIETNGAADDGRVSIETPLPERVRNDRNSVAGLLVLMGKESAAQTGLYAKSVEQIRGHARGIELLGFSGAGEGGAAGMNCGDVLEGSRVLTEFQEQGGAHWEGGVGVGDGGHDFMDADETVGLGEGEWTQERAVDDGKDRRVGPDS